MNGVLIASLYAPNGNPQPGPKFDYKLAWLERLAAHAAELYAAGVPVVLAGDYNVVPTDADIYPTKSWDDDALLQPESRAAFGACSRRAGSTRSARFIRQSRCTRSGTTCATAGRAMPGLRLDHLLLSPDVASRLVEAPASTATCAARTTRATTRRPGSSCAMPRSGARRAAAKSRQGAKAPTARKTAPAKRAPDRRPLLVIDGDFFAHRSYHALPKTILRTGNKGAGAIVGFANFLLRLYATEQPRAVLVGWDTLDAPTYRHQKFPAYQSGRRVRRRAGRAARRAAGIGGRVRLCQCKGRGYEADDFLAAAVAAEERRGGTVLVASGDRDTFQLASETTTILYPLRAGEMARIGPARGARALWRRAQAGAGFHRAARRPVRQAAGRRRRRPEGRRRSHPPLRLAGRRAGRRPLSHPGGHAAALPLDRDDERGRAAAAARRSGADLCGGGRACPRVGAQPAGRAAGRDGRAKPVVNTVRWHFSRAWNYGEAIAVPRAGEGEVRVTRWSFGAGSIS